MARGASSGKGKGKGKGGYTQPHKVSNHALRWQLRQARLRGIQLPPWVR